MAGKAEVVVFNHDFEGKTSLVGSPSAANPELASCSLCAVIGCHETGSAWKALITVLQHPSQEGFVARVPVLNEVGEIVNGVRQRGDFAGLGRAKPSELALVSEKAKADRGLFERSQTSREFGGRGKGSRLVHAHGSEGARRSMGTRHQESGDLEGKSARVGLALNSREAVVNGCCGAREKENAQANGQAQENERVGEKVRRRMYQR
jgi:hypothetical protein